MSKNVAVIYHASCSDGFCCAWLMSKVYPEAEFIPCQYGDPVPDVRGKRVFILDFSFKRKEMLELCRSAGGQVVLLDHHESAEHELKNLHEEFSSGEVVPQVLINQSKSGARLTWEWLWPILIEDQDPEDQRESGEPYYLESEIVGFDLDGLLPTKDLPPWIVLITEDRDLWKFELPHSREINAALRSYPLEFEVWDDLVLNRTRRASDLLELAKEGEAILRYQQQIVDSHIKHAAETVIAGQEVLCVNCTVSGLISDVAGELAKDRPFGACYFEKGDGKRIYSLRSREGGVNVSEIARRFGGGGHPQAAGFTVGSSRGIVDYADEGGVVVVFETKGGDTEEQVFSASLAGESLNGILPAKGDNVRMRIELVKAEVRQEELDALFDFPDDSQGKRITGPIEF